MECENWPIHFDIGELGRGGRQMWRPADVLFVFVRSTKHQTTNIAMHARGRHNLLNLGKTPL
jgi:hypothetical protein